MMMMEARSPLDHTNTSSSGSPVTPGGGGGGGLGLGLGMVPQYDAHGNPIKQPPQRNSANARERDRTHSVNTAFVTLRTLIPTEPADRKLSKIETLRLATSYIAHLSTVLMAGGEPADQVRNSLDIPCIN
jgi:hypothetical protein